MTLLWAPETKTVAVYVWDAVTDDRFKWVVEPGLNPIDVYEHPYAYAAWRGVDYDTAHLPEAA